MAREITSYQDGVRYLYGLQKYGIKFGLSKTVNLLKAFGKPHEGRSYIHIAGTNGKGSVASFVASILKESGLRVGLYSSPHLVRFTERFRINDVEITREKAATLIEELREAFVQEEPPTYFEATTAMALAYFAREETDIAIVEVGMGGRLDATNVISALVSVITNISMEHQAFLGHRLLDIAGEKGGIIKHGTDVVIGATQKAVIGLFESICAERGSLLWRLGKDIRYKSTASGLHYHGLERRLKRLRIGLGGRFQIRNAVLALAVVERLEKKGFEISEQHIRDGLVNTVWPGRMQVVAQNPVIVLDGAHNPAAMRALCCSIKRGFVYRRLILVIGVMEDKDIDSILRGIVPLSDYVIYTRPVYPRAAGPEVLMDKAAFLGKPGELVPLLPAALDRAKEMASIEDLILVTGSFFTVGEALVNLDPETYMPDDVENEEPSR